MIRTLVLPLQVNGDAVQRTNRPLSLRWKTVEPHQAMPRWRLSTACTRRTSETSLFRYIEDDQTIKTDKYPSYNILDVAFYHFGDIVKPQEAMEKLPWVHILIGNAKSFIRGTYHGVSHKHLQKYLSEFCYRFNRRFNEFQITDRLLTACLSISTITYAELTR